jgi:chemotaxis family two-component system response regulator Rcp1
MLELLPLRQRLHRPRGRTRSAPKLGRANYEADSEGCPAPAPSSSGSQDTPSRPIRILLAEDNPADVYLVREALREQGLEFVLDVVEDGEKAFQYLERAETDRSLPCPDLFIVDLNMPKRSGMAFLKRIRESDLCGSTPVVILTSSDSPRDRQETLELGASRYIRKPSDFDAFLQVGSEIFEVWRRSQN